MGMEVLDASPLLPTAVFPFQLPPVYVYQPKVSVVIIERKSMVGGDDGAQDSVTLGSIYSVTIHLPLIYVNKCKTIISNEIYHY
jgi:hypothetical protein